MQAVILAGGRGQRLDPFSRVLPKPLFPLGDEAMAAILVKQLKKAGAVEIIMSLGYLADLVMAYFQDGSRFGLPIRYVVESKPLGTAGPLKTVTGLADDFLVVNADELTNLDFGKMLEDHCRSQADMTVAVQKKSAAAAFGMLEIDAGRVTAYKEKPAFDYWASMGIYALNRRCLALIPPGDRFDMPELVRLLTERQGRVMSYESRDLWYDIGTLPDLASARRALTRLNVPETPFPATVGAEEESGQEAVTRLTKVPGTYPAQV